MATRLSLPQALRWESWGVKYSKVPSSEDSSLSDASQEQKEQQLPSDGIPTTNRILSLPQAGAIFIVAVLVCFVALRSRGGSDDVPAPHTPFLQRPLPKPIPVPFEAPEGHVPCFGARGKLLTESPDDQITEVQFRKVDMSDLPLGSYSSLSLERAWTTPDGRYGPYGFRQHADPPNTNPREPVEWTQLDWAEIQNNCTARNMDRFGPGVKPISSLRRMAYPNEENTVKKPPRPAITTGRTAIVLRGWEEFEFRGQDRWHLRALITETALALGGDYAVYLLVDVHDPKWKVFKSDENYEAALEALVPPEFRNMTVLFDEKLLKKWYPKIREHSMHNQVWQPMELFAHFFDDFDWYWQFEMDARFTGHAGRFLEAMSTFARNEPRKQSRERSTFMYSDQAYGNYSNLVAAVDKALDGGTEFWRGFQIPDIEQIGPEPPVETPEEDDFEWGVGEDADCVIMGPCHNLKKSAREKFRKWIFGFKHWQDVDRVICPPASSRNSWNLLNGVHNGQREKGMAITSEGTMPSFALWLGLKISKPPFPIYIGEKHSPRKVDMLLNGGQPTADKQGMARGYLSKHNPDGRREHGIMFDNVEMTWRPRAEQAQRAADAWLSQSTGKPWVRPLYVHDGEVWMPNTIMHPVKTNENGPKTDD